MIICRVCGKEVNNLRMHCSGKWHNDPGDYEHLYLALQLTPGASAYLKTFEEIDNRPKEKREDVPGLRQEADQAGGEPTPAIKRLFTRRSQDDRAGEELSLAKTLDRILAKRSNA